MGATKNAGINAKVKPNLGSGVTIIFAPPPANIRYGLTVLIHNSGHFGPPLPFWGPRPPALPGLPMASYAIVREICPRR